MGSGAWQTFFGAAAASAATLAGLVFVAMSVNIREILKHANLPPRAAAAIASLMLVLASSLAALMPQPSRWLGVEVVLVALGPWAVELRAATAARRVGRLHARPRFEWLFAAALGQARVLGFVLAGALLAAGFETAGFAWLAAVVVAVIGVALVDAWVLLVEILR